MIMLVQLFKTVLLLSVIGGAFTVVLLLTKPMTKRAFSSRWQYYIWLEVLIVMMLPITIKIPANINFNPQTPQQIAPMQASTAALAQGARMEAPLQGAENMPMGSSYPIDNQLSTHIVDILSFVWLLGAIAFFVRRLISYFLFSKTIHKHSTGISCPALEIVKAEHGIKGDVQIRLTEHINAPLLVGVLKPTLLLPNMEMSEQSLRHILLHELTHYRRHDLFYKWFAMIVNSVHWFNPFIYLAVKQISEGCELSCDSIVTANMNELDKSGYMDTILNLLAKSKMRTQALSTAMAGGTKQIKRRFTMIRQAKKTSHLMSAVSGITAVVLVATTLLASGVLAYAAGGNDAVTTIEVYNNKTKIVFRNNPFIQDGEVYLPLRETLSHFDICDMTWNDGQIQIALPLSNEYTGYRPANYCIVAIGSAQLDFPSTSWTRELRRPPVLKDETTYVPWDFFECLVWCGQIPQFQLELTGSSNPEDYYSPGEEVFIGTGLAQDHYNPVDNEGNRRLVKRIITDESGAAIAVVTVENQMPDVINKELKTNASGAYGFQKIYQQGTVTMNLYGEMVECSRGIFVYKDETQAQTIAYIPPADQINQSRQLIKPQLTLETVIELSKRDDVTWADFEHLRGKEVGSGQYIMEYPIDATFSLRVGGVSSAEKPLFLFLDNNETNVSIDIKQNDVQSFIKNGTAKMLIRRWTDEEILEFNS